MKKSTSVSHTQKKKNLNVVTKQISIVQNEVISVVGLRRQATNFNPQKHEEGKEDTLRFDCFPLTPLKGNKKYENK